MKFITLSEVDIIRLETCKALITIVTRKLLREMIVETLHGVQCRFVHTQQDDKHLPVTLHIQSCVRYRNQKPIVTVADHDV